MLVATLEIARNSIDQAAPDFWGREVIIFLIDGAVADDCRRVLARDRRAVAPFLSKL